MYKCMLFGVGLGGTKEEAAAICLKKLMSLSLFFLSDLWTLHQWSACTCQTKIEGFNDRHWASAIPLYKLYFALSWWCLCNKQPFKYGRLNLIAVFWPEFLLALGSVPVCQWMSETIPAIACNVIFGIIICLAAGLDNYCHAAVNWIIK